MTDPCHPLLRGFKPHRDSQEGLWRTLGEGAGTWVATP